MFRLLLFLTSTYVAFAKTENVFIEFVNNHFLDQTICVIYSNETLIPSYLLHLEHPKTFYCKRSHYNKYNHLIIIKGMEELKRIAENLMEYNNKAKYLLKINDPIDHNDLRRCFNILWSNDVYNLVVLVKNDAHTWYPYSKQKIISTNLTHPFSNKIPKTFYQHPVKLIWSPVFIFTTPPHQKTLGYINRILILIGEKIGLKMLFDKEEEPFAVSEHRNKVKAVNLTRIVVEEKVDVVANAYGPSIALITDKTVELSFPITSHTDYWLLPRRKPLTVLSTLIFALTPLQYLLIAISFLLVTITWYFSKSKQESFSSSLFSVFKILLLQPIRINNKHQKIIFLFSWFFAAHITSLYTSHLYTLFYKPAYPQPFTTLEEVLDETNYNFAYTSYVESIVRNLSENNWIQIESRKLPQLYNAKTRSEIMCGLKDLVFSIGNLDLLGVLNPQDVEMLPEKV